MGLHHAICQLHHCACACSKVLLRDAWLSKCATEQIRSEQGQGQGQGNAGRRVVWGGTRHLRPHLRWPQVQLEQRLRLVAVARVLLVHRLQALREPRCRGRRGGKGLADRELHRVRGGVKVKVGGGGGETGASARCVGGCRSVAPAASTLASQRQHFKPGRRGRVRVFGHCTEAMRQGPHMLEPGGIS